MIDEKIIMELRHEREEKEKRIIKIALRHEIETYKNEIEKLNSSIKDIERILENMEKGGD